MPDLKATWEEGRNEPFYPYGKMYDQTLGEGLRLFAIKVGNNGSAGTLMRVSKRVATKFSWHRQDEQMSF
jgi:hypothetical protein